MNWCKTRMIIFTLCRAAFILVIWWDSSWSLQIQSVCCCCKETGPYPLPSSSPAAALVESSRKPEVISPSEPNWALGSPQTPGWDHTLITYSGKTSRRLTQPNARTHILAERRRADAFAPSRCQQRRRRLPRRRADWQRRWRRWKQRAAGRTCVRDRLLVVVVARSPPRGCFTSPVQTLVAALLSWRCLEKHLMRVYIALRQSPATKRSLF